MMMTQMDSRIGTLNNGQFYAFANGYDQPEVCGTLNEVEAALGLPLTATASPVAKGDTYTVTIRFQYPAWDEVNGIVYDGVAARTKSEAIAYIRTRAFADGHTGRGKGRYTFTAEVE